MKSQLHDRLYHTALYIKLDVEVYLTLLAHMQYTHAKQYVL